jgi:hypothetical protein
MKKWIKPATYERFVESRVDQLPGTAPSDTWEGVLGNYFNTRMSLPEMYQAYLQWHFKKFTKLGRYLYETED